MTTRSAASRAVPSSSGPRDGSLSTASALPQGTTVASTLPRTLATFWTCRGTGWAVPFDAPLPANCTGALGAVGIRVVSESSSRESSHQRRPVRPPVQLKALQDSPVPWRRRHPHSAPLHERRDSDFYIHLHDGVLRVGSDGRLAVFLDAQQTDDPRSGVVFAAVIWSIAHSGLPILHSCSLACDDRVALVLGPSGAGKSTLAAAWIASGRRIVSDDSVVCLPPRQPGGTWAVQPWRADLTLRGGMARLLPEQFQRELRKTGAAGKALLPRLLFPGSFANRGNVAAVLILARSPGAAHATLTRGTQASAFAAAVAGTGRMAADLPLPNQPLYHRLQQLVTATPVFQLRVTTRLLQDPAAEADHVCRLLESTFASS
jgi:hypothetical protein